MKEFTISKVELNLKKEVEREFLWRRETVDGQDRVLDATEYNASGDQVHRVTYRYSPFDNVSERVEMDAFNGLIERHLYTENEDGEVTSSTIEFGNGAKTTKTYAFTDLGNADKATLTDENGIILGYETFILDDQERLISEFESDADHKELFRINREFDDQGRLIQEVEFSYGEIDQVTRNTYQNDQLVKVERGKSLDSFYATEVRELDVKGRLKKRTITDHEFGDVEVEEFEYDANGNVLSNLVTHNGRTIFTNVCTYDNSNRLTEEYVMELTIGGSINKHERLYHNYQD